MIVPSKRIERTEIVDAAWADNGPGWVAVLLESAAAVPALGPGFVDLDLGVVGPYPDGSPCAFEVRAFFPKNGSTAEDPVTGSLDAALAQWLLDGGRATAPYVASQGTALGRAGRVQISRDDDGTIWGRRRHHHLRQRPCGAVRRRPSCAETGWQPAEPSSPARPMNAVLGPTFAAWRRLDPTDAERTGGTAISNRRCFA